jgi:hypothetical protein
MKVPVKEVFLEGNSSGKFESHFEVHGGLYEAYLKSKYR